MTIRLDMHDGLTVRLDPILNSMQFESDGLAVRLDPQGWSDGKVGSLSKLSSVRVGWSGGKVGSAMVDGLTVSVLETNQESYFLLCAVVILYASWCAHRAATNRFI